MRIKAAAIFVMLALFECCIAAPAHTASPCPEVFVVRDGRLFTQEDVTKPGFDAKTSPSSVGSWCDGDLYPTDDAALLVKDSKQLKIERERLEIERRGRDNDKVRYEGLLSDCEQRESIEHEGRVLCELDKGPSPTSKPEPPTFYEKAAFWVGTAILAGSVTYGIAAKDEHPILFGAGGIGVGMMIGSAF